MEQRVDAHSSLSYHVHKRRWDLVQRERGLIETGSSLLKLGWQGSCHPWPFGVTQFLSHVLSSHVGPYYYVLLPYSQDRILTGASLSGDLWLKCRQREHREHWGPVVQIDFVTSGNLFQTWCTHKHHKWAMSHGDRVGLERSWFGLVWGTAVG